MRYEIRELDVGGILDQAIKLTKDHFWLFMKISAVVLLPALLIAGLLVLWNMPDVPTVAQPGIFVPGAYRMPPSVLWITAVTGLFNGIVVYPLTDAALIYAIANCYLEKPISMGSAFRKAFGRFLPLLGTWIVMGLAIGAPIIVALIVAGMLRPMGILLIIPAAIFSLVCAYWFILSPRVVVIEGLAGTKALNRSKLLMKGNFGTVFVLGIVILIISAMITWTPRLLPQAELRVVTSAVLQAIMSFFVAAVWVVFYFSCRCKVENFDLTMLADSVAAEDAPATQ